MSFRKQLGHPNDPMRGSFSRSPQRTQKGQSQAGPRDQSMASAVDNNNGQQWTTMDNNGQ